MALSASWLALSVPGALGAAFGLFRVVRGLLRTTRRAVVASAPLAPAAAPAPVDLVEAGRFSLWLETARFAGPAFRMRRVGFGLTSEAGDPVELHPVLATRRVSSLHRVRVEIARVDVRPGRYLVWVQDPADVAAFGPTATVVVARPIGRHVVGYVLALIVLGWALIGGIVVTALVLTGAELTSGS